MQHLKKKIKEQEFPATVSSYSYLSLLYFFQWMWIFLLKIQTNEPPLVFCHTLSSIYPYEF